MLEGESVVINRFTQVSCFLALSTNFAQPASDLSRMQESGNLKSLLMWVERWNSSFIVEAYTERGGS